LVIKHISCIHGADDAVGDRRVGHVDRRVCDRDDSRRRPSAAILYTVVTGDSIVSALNHIIGARA